MSNRSRHHKKLDRDGVRKPRSRDGGEGSGPKGKRPGPLSLGSEDIAGLLSLGTEDRVEAIRELQGRFGNRRVSTALDSSPRSSAPDAGAATPSEPLAAARDDESKDDLDRVPDEVSRRIAGERGGGSSLEQGTRQDMETALGHDFAGVQVHTGPAADDLNRELSATAFTTGQDVFFRDGAYAPGSRDGRELLAHELTHVVQQSGPLPEPRGGITSPDDATEVEAARVGEAVARQPEEEEELMTAARQPEEEEEIMAVARSLDKDAVLRQDSDDESDEKTRLLSALDDIPDEEFIDVGVSSKDEEDPSADAEAKQLATDVGAELGVLKGKESLAAMFVGLLPEESEDDAPLLESPAVDEQLRQGKLTRWLKGAWGFLTKAGSAAGGGIVTGPPSRSWRRPVRSKPDGPRMRSPRSRTRPRGEGIPIWQGPSAMRQVRRGRRRSATPSVQLGRPWASSARGSSLPPTRSDGRCRPSVSPLPAAWWLTRPTEGSSRRAGES